MYRRNALKFSYSVKENMALHQELRGHLVALGTVFMWGLTFISTKVLLTDYTPLEVLFFRFVLGYITLVIFYPKALPIKSFKEEKLFMAAGFSGVTLYFLMENIAINYTLASNVGIIVAIAPFCTAILAQVLLRGYARETLNWTFFLGFVVAMCGIGLIVFNGAVHLQLNPLGDILAAGAALTWAFYSIFMRMIGELRYSMAVCTRRVFFYGVLFMLPVVAWQGVHFDMATFLKPINAANFFFLAVICSSVCFATWSWSVKVLGAVKASAYIYLVPVVAVGFSALILDENITKLAMIGTALTLTGLVISEIKPRKKQSKQGA